MSNYLIIGASSGIGFSTASRLHKDGHNVYGTFRNEEKVPDLDIHWHQLDVLDNELDLAFLPEDLSGLVYCPGSIDLKPFKRIKPKDFTSDFNLQVVGAIKIIQGVLPKLKKVEHASIVLFSTVATQVGFNFHTKVSVSKGAIEGLTRSLAAELAPKIRVNAIAPSITDTPLASKLLNTEEKISANAERHPLRRIGKPSDIGSAATFLLGDQSNWITGQVIHVDGGISKLRV